MIRSTLAICAGLLAAGAACSQPPMDADGDGAVSLPELQAVRPGVSAERFSELDDDGDGLLSREELRGARERSGDRPRRRFPEGIDTDGDGAVSLPELQAVRPQMTQERFERMDENGDGLITAEERRSRRDRPRGDRRARGGEDCSREDTT